MNALLIFELWYHIIGTGNSGIYKSGFYRRNVEKGAWFKIGVNNMQNSSGEDIVVYITVSGVDVRIE